MSQGQTASTMSCSRRSTARRRCFGKSGGTWVLYSTSLLGARNARSREIKEGHLLAARPCAYADIDPAEIFSGGGDRISERQELDLDRAECGTQGAESSYHKLWARGYFVSTVGRNEEIIRAYIRNQEMADKQLDQLQLNLRPHEVPSFVPESFITAFGGSLSNPQLCWGLLIRESRQTQRFHTTSGQGRPFWPRRRTSGVPPAAEAGQRGRPNRLPARPRQIYYRVTWHRGSSRPAGLMGLPAPLRASL
jgi:hypothetical protein